MNIYDAIMKAADHIERNPSEFRFLRSAVPSAPFCGSPGCALGWIGVFSASKAIDSGDVAQQVLCVPNEDGLSSELTFYNRMNDLLSDTNWIRHADLCARGMRLYAKKYHHQITPPDWKTIAGSPLIPEHVRSEEVA